jgi:outer membrane protein OmpA-like peptidoglycan-associated protein
MIKKLTVIVLILGCINPCLAQLDPYNYRLGLGMGYTNYYGDLSPYRVDGLRNISRHFDYNRHYIPEASYRLSLEGRISRSMSLMFSAGQYHMSMSDRYQDSEGNLQRQLPNFNRSLNFQTKLQDAGIDFVFRTDNDRFLNKTAFMAPYFTLGAGIFQFDVRGDLLDDMGLPYDYSNEAVMPNNQFETNLRPLHTELEEGYQNFGFYYGVGFGIRFKIAKQIELFIQSDFKHTSSDYIDDVSGVYRQNYTDEFQAYAAQPGTNDVEANNGWRGDPNSRNDWYIFHHAGLKISFAPSKKAFRASTVSPGTTFAISQAKQQMEEDSLRLEADKASTLPPTNQYFNFFQMNPPSRGGEQLSWRVSKAEENIGLIEDQREEEIYNRSVEGLYNEIDSLNQLATVWANLEEPSEQDQQFINSMNNYRTSLSEKVDSVSRQRQLLNDRIILRKSRLDSLNQIKFDNPEGVNSGFDTMLFNQNFQEFYGHLNRALIQDDNWRQLSQRIDQSSQKMQQPDFQGSPSGQNTPAYSGVPGQAQAYYQDQPYQPRYNPYRYDPGEQNVYVEADGFYQNRTSPPPRERQPRTRTFYQSAPPASRRDRSNQRSNAFIPVPIPIIGNRNKNPEEQQISPNDTFPAKQAESTIPLPPPPFIDSLQLSPSTDSLSRAGVDTLYLEKETVIGLPNSKKDVYFGTNRESLDNEEKEKLQAIVAILDTQPDYYITLAGFADNTGNISYNLNLIDRRVNHVKSLLVNEYGIDEKRISIRPGGLLVRDKSRGSRSEDRKVEILIQDRPPVK